MRYVGQGHEITVPLPLRDVTAQDAVGLRAAFEREYSVLFKSSDPRRCDRSAELVGAHFDAGASARRHGGGGEQARALAGRQPRVL